MEEQALEKQMTRIMWLFTINAVVFGGAAIFFFISPTPFWSAQMIPQMTFGLIFSAGALWHAYWAYQIWRIKR